MFKLLNKLSIGRRMWASFGVLSALILVVAISGHISQNRVTDAALEALDRDAQISDDADLARFAIAEMRRYEKDYLLDIGRADAEAANEARWLATREIMRTTLAELAKLVVNDEDHKALASINKEFEGYDVGFQKLVGASKAGGVTDSRHGEEIIQPVLDDAQRLEDAAKEMAVRHIEHMDKAPARIDAIDSNADLVRLLVTVVALAFAVVLAIFITRSITRPLKDAVASATLVAQGRFQITASEEIGQISQAFNGVRDALVETRELKDKVEKDNEQLQRDIMNMLTVVAEASDGNLTVRAKIGEGALGNVADAFNALMESLQGILAQVSGQIDKTNTAIAEIRKDSVSMSSGAASQTAQILTARDLVRRLSDEITKVSEGAKGAAEAAKRTESSAEEGSKAVQNVITGMGTLRANVQAGAKKMKNLGDRSMEITGIVGTISRISEQTNMLALNAAIEAARAGEHGRGFSVVAEEVRKLAERTANATQEIDKLVKAIHQETNETVGAIEQQTQVVERESELVGQAGASLMKIRQVSGESAKVVVDISATARDQVDGTGQVMKAMEQITAIAAATQKGAEGTALTLAQLVALSDELKQGINRFKVG